MILSYLSVEAIVDANVGDARLVAVLRSISTNKILYKIKRMDLQCSDVRYAYNLHMIYLYSLFCWYCRFSILALPLA